MGIRYNFEETKKIVENLSDCELIEFWYENNRKQMKLKCSCGKEFQVDWRLFNRKDGRPIRECDICRNEHKRKSKYINKIVGDFLILDNWNEDGRTIYKAKCIYCNKIKIGGRTIVDHGSCDCQKIIRLCNRNTRLGGIYHSMLQRCYNPNNEEYKNYGGRGITVCDEWQTYPPFEEWSLKHGYKDNLSIDRINVNGDYSPANCRWATNREQSLNKRNNHFVEYNGKNQTVQEWGEELGIKPNTLIYRLRRGWSVEDALTRPVKKK